MRVIYTIDELSSYLRDLYHDDLEALTSAPLLIDRFLEAAVEVDVDAVFDGSEILFGGVMEHVEEAGVHSGDSACVVPPPTISEEAHKRILTYTEDLARALAVRGLLNIQYAVRGDEVFVLEANPRASRTVPFISKATGVPLAKVATRVMMGTTIDELRAEGMVPGRLEQHFVAVKEAVMPWNRFPAQDTILGPEMRATGEVMGIGRDTATAYAKSLAAAGHRVPSTGTVFFSLADRDKTDGVAVAEAFVDFGFRLLATQGTWQFLTERGIPAAAVDKVGDGPWDPVRLIAEGKVDLVINTPRGRRARGDGRLIRQASLAGGIPCVTTLPGALALVDSLGATEVTEVKSLQEYHT